MPCRQNGERDPRLTVDFTFDSCAHPFAVEVTSLTDHFESPTPDAVEGLRQRLESEATRLEWPHWWVGIRPETKLKGDLPGAVATMMRYALELGVKELGAATYSADLGIMATRLKPEFHRECDRARLLGVISVRRAESGGIVVLPVCESSDSNSLRRPLERAMSAKTKSLGESKRRRYSTMLAIDVERADAHGCLREGVRVPGFPRDIDHLWLFVRHGRRGELRHAYYANRDDRRLVRVGP